jgi:hypothetical protein
MRYQLRHVRLQSQQQPKAGDLTVVMPEEP